MTPRSHLSRASRTLAAISVSLGISLGAGYAASAAAQPPAAMVGVDEVRSETLTQTVPVIGRLVARRSGNVAARLDGALERMDVQVGDRLERGALIAQMEEQVPKAVRDRASAQRDEAAARLATARAQLALVQQERDRLAKLKNTQATSRALYDDVTKNVTIAQARVREAEAAVATAAAQLRLAEIDLEHARVIAPYAGVVIQRIEEVGAYVRTGDPLVRMMADENMEVEADVPFDRLSGLTPGAKVQVVLDEGSIYDAEVRAVIPDENALTRTRAVRFTPRIDASSGGLAEGQSVTVRIPVGAQRDIVTVHKDGINRRGGGASVYVVAKDTAQIRPVRLGQPVGARIEVLDGLQPGEKVVVRGNERLRPNAKVTIGPPS